jgi:hypothetical protein
VKKPHKKAFNMFKCKEIGLIRHTSKDSLFLTSQRDNFGHLSINKIPPRIALPLEKLIGPQLAKKFFVSLETVFHFRIPKRPPPVSVLSQVISVRISILLLEYPF